MTGLVTLVLFSIFAAVSFLANRRRKRQMRNALGREIESHEMTSLNSWMDVAKSEDAVKKKNL